MTAAGTPDEYIASLPEDRRGAVSAVRDVINANLPPGRRAHARADGLGR